MKRSLLLVLPFALGACPSSESNPPELWLAPKNGEVDVKLVDHEPHPF